MKKAAVGVAAGAGAGLAAGAAVGLSHASGTSLASKQEGSADAQGFVAGLDGYASDLLSWIQTPAAFAAGLAMGKNASKADKEAVIKDYKTTTNDVVDHVTGKKWSDLAQEYSDRLDTSESSLHTAHIIEVALGVGAVGMAAVAFALVGRLLPREESTPPSVLPSMSSPAGQDYAALFREVSAQAAAREARATEARATEARVEGSAPRSRRFVAQGSRPTLAYEVARDLLSEDVRQPQRRELAYDTESPPADSSLVGAARPSARGWRGWRGWWDPRARFRAATVAMPTPEASA